MSQYNLVSLNRNEYLIAIDQLEQDKSLRFAKMSLSWWDKLYGWHTKGCCVLTDEQNRHLCYIFFKIDKFNDYITIHNIFTPDVNRRRGYANILLEIIFDLAVAKKVKRFRLTCISKSLDFYLALGLVYWGVNSVGDFYCDLPMPKDGLGGIKEMIIQRSIPELIGAEFATINNKINNNSLCLTAKQTQLYESDLLRLKENYLLSDFLAERESQKRRWK